MSLHLLSRNRVNREGEEMFDIMGGDGNPESWTMFAEKLTKNDAEMVIRAIDYYWTTHTRGE